MWILEIRPQQKRDSEVTLLSASSHADLDCPLGR